MSEGLFCSLQLRPETRCFYRHVTLLSSFGFLFGEAVLSVLGFRQDLYSLSSPSGSRFVSSVLPRL